MRETVNQPRKWDREYQVYYRNPITRKFVAIPDTQIKLNHELTDIQLSDGIPSLSYRGLKLWRK